MFGFERILLFVAINIAIKFVENYLNFRTLAYNWHVHYKPQVRSSLLSSYSARRFAL